MNTRTTQLGFTVPEQDPNYQSKLHFTPEAMLKWRKSLPIADTGATAKKLYLALRDLNQSVLPPEQRFEVLEVIRPIVQIICQSMNKHFVQQSGHLTKEKQAIAQLAQTLQLDMAAGYKVVIDAMHEKRLIGKTKQIVVTALIRTMHYFAHVFIRCNFLYSLSPRGIWRELYILYEFAESHKILDVEIINEIEKDKKHTIDNIFKEALLLEAINPLQWRQKEQEVITAAINVWAPFAAIRNAAGDDFQSKPSLYVFDLHKDLQPCPISLGRVEPSASCRVLDLVKVVEHLKPILSQMKTDELRARLDHEGDSEYNISGTILQRLVKNWQSRIRRAATRFPLPGKMQIAFGLSATHYHSSEGKNFNLKLGATNDNEGDDDDLSLDFVDMDASSLPDSGTSEQSEYPYYEFKTEDISPAGVCLSWEEESVPPIQPGEIIAMRTAELDMQAKWSIGAVRWILNLDEKKLKVGIQLLAPFAKTAGVQILKADKPAGYVLRCLILPKMESLEVEQTIITPTLPFKVGKRVMVHQDDGEVEALLTKEIDATGSFRQFEFNAAKAMQLDAFKDQTKNAEEKPSSALEEQISNHIEEPERIDNSKTTPDEDATEFDNIWDDL